MENKKCRIKNCKQDGMPLDVWENQGRMCWDHFIERLDWCENHKTENGAARTFYDKYHEVAEAVEKAGDTMFDENGKEVTISEYVNRLYGARPNPNAARDHH